MSSPRAFISHASEDKAAFVVRFAELLRSQGVEAWLDQWEMAGGDSLIQKIFDEGIENADAVIVVLSKVSVSKPWVQEELAAGVIRKISGKCRLIPIRLDEVEVPASLTHLIWIPVPGRSIEAVAAEVVKVLYNVSIKPPLGPAPSFATESSVAVQSLHGSTVLDKAVLTELVRELHDWPLESVLMTDEVQLRCQARGILLEDFNESMHALIKHGLVVATPMLGGPGEPTPRWWITRISDRVWLEYEAADGLDVAEARGRLLAAILNEDPDDRNHPVEHTGLSDRTTLALLKALEGEGLLKASDHAPAVLSVDPLARRAAL